MNIDINKVNLSEKDIEDWLYENPGEIVCNAYCTIFPIVRWIGRQYALPSGIADLVGLRADNKIVVVEVKNVPINKAAVLQVCRYAHDLESILVDTDYRHIRDFTPVIDKILIGPSIDGQTLGEADAVNVKVISFAAEMNLSLYVPSFTNEYSAEKLRRLHEIAARAEWAIFSGDDPPSDVPKDEYDEFMESVGTEQDDSEEAHHG